MPRRNFALLLLVTAISLVCYQKVQTNRFGRIIVDAMDQVQRRCLEPVKANELFEGAMEGMMGRLDEHSAFIGQANYQEFRESLEQQFGGVGMEVGLDPKTRQLTVLSPMVGTPAYEAGIRTGDRILRIGEQSTQGLSLKDAVAKLRGRIGEPIVLSILHEGEPRPQEIKLVRTVINIDTVLGDTRNPDGTWNFFLEGRDHIGYVRINTFAEKTPGELRRALDWLVGHRMRGLVLDLRNDPGGLLESAVQICDMFIDSGPIVTTRGRNRQIVRMVEASGKGAYLGFPMAVLVNQYSASASEIVAACLQDHHRATIVGQRTWGKGTVQELMELEGGQMALKLTTASYWRPSDKNIHRRRGAADGDVWGVSPDDGCKVLVEGEDLNRLRLWRMHRDVVRPSLVGDPPRDKADLSADPQLLKAVEAVEKK